MKIYILGGKGNGLVVACALFRNFPTAELAFLNDVNTIGDTIGKYKTIPVVGATDEIEKRILEDDTFVISAYGGLEKTKKAYQKLHSLSIPEDKWLRFIDSSAVVPREFCHIGYDTFVGPLAQISPNVDISNHVSMFGNSFIGHDTTIGEYCRITSNAVVGSSVTIEKCVHIGLNCTIREGVTVGEYSIIGAGSVVVKDVPAGSVIVGNPARVLKMMEFD